MKQSDAIDLIDHPLLHPTTPVHWADLGCGSGTFTLALAALLPPDSIIEAIDLRPGISRQTTANGVKIVPRSEDFVAADLGLSGLDGILMANSLHYVHNKPALLQKLHACYDGGGPASETRVATLGALLLVEYDTDRPTPHWVPYPLSFSLATKLLPAAGWPHIQKLGSRPSEYFVGAASPRSSSSVPFASLGNGRSELYALLAVS